MLTYEIDILRGYAAMQKRSRLQTALLVLLLVLTVLAAAHSLFVGLEIDEQYALSVSYRLLRGDRLLYTMWEPHQFSALPLAPLLALFMAVTGGTTGILLFVRIVTVLIKAALAVWAWRLLRRAMYEPFAMLLAAGTFLYVPKWFYGPEYAHQQYLFTLAALLCLYSYYAGPRRLQRPWQVAAAAVCASFSYLAFPQSIAAAVSLFIGLWVLGRKSGEPLLFGKAPRGAVLFAGTCVLCGAAFLVWLFSGVPVSLFFSRLELILHDPQYDFTFAQRMASFGWQVQPILRFLATPAALAVLLGVAHSFATRRRHGSYSPWMAVDNFIIDLCVTSLLWCAVYAAREGNFDMRHFVPILVAAGGWVFWADRKAETGRTERAVLFWLGWLPGLVAYAFILRSSLIGLVTTFMYLTLPAVCSIAALALRPSQEERSPRHRPDGSGAGTVLSLFLLFLALTRLLAVQVTGWREHSVWETPVYHIPSGPAAGIWADANAADMQAALGQALAGAEPGTKLCLATGYLHGLAFLMDDGTLAVGQASVISGTDSDPRFIAYYTEFPEKIPDIVIFDNNTERDMAAFRAWVEQTLPIAGRETVNVGTASLDVLHIEQ